MCIGPWKLVQLLKNGAVRMMDALIFHGRNFPSAAVLSRLCGPPSGDLTVCDLGRTMSSGSSKPAVHFVERFFDPLPVWLRSLPGFVRR